MILYLTLTLDIAKPVEELETQVLFELHETLNKIPPAIAFSKSVVVQKFTDVSMSVDRKVVE